MITFRLFVLDSDDDFHIVASCRRSNIDAAFDQFFPRRTYDDLRLEVEAPDNSTLLVVDSAFTLADGNDLTYVITSRERPESRAEYFGAT